MKNIRSLIAVSLLFAATTAVFAQMENRPLMKVDIPFSFAADNHTLPAGEYYVLSVTPERAIRLTSTDGKHTLTVNDLPNYTGSPSPNSRLVFHRYGDEYFLVQVWTKGDNVARNPMVSPRAMELARAGSHPEDMIVLAYAGK